MSTNINFLRKFFKDIVEIASKATYKYKHGALLIKGNKILSRGYNRSLGEKCGLASYHAEKMALLNCEKECYTRCNVIGC